MKNLHASLLFIGLGILGVLIAFGNHHPFQNPFESQKPDGLKGFYRILQIWQPEIVRWKRPLYTLTDQADKVGTIVIADPVKPLGPKEKKGLDSWLERGGLVVLMKWGDWSVKRLAYHQEEEESFYELYGIDMSENEDLSQSFGDEGRIMVIPGLLYNSTLLDRPEWLAPAIQEIVKQKGPVYFDEYHLTSGSENNFFKSLASFFQTAWGWAFLHLSTAFLLAFFILQPRRELRVESKEDNRMALIQGRGLLLQEAKAKEFCQQAINNYDHYFHRRSR
ncbi:MAG: DUF4350 domain-containing protein [Parachlamydia sp.]|nr:DUF4350 domain-containing protein [Parachlamydia sp.]